MCGKESDSTACPQCGSFEDAQHVWVCMAASVCTIWEGGIGNLTRWLQSVDTDPDIVEAIVIGLCHWYFHDSNVTAIPSRIENLFRLQEEIG